ncbi:hypothetical protein ALP93_200244 [Pseudomonas syringae pv. helianthi]|nr:hypothetical protein ALP93_200244 [Pseudomonas syringae pv. helianthi]
MDQSSILDLWYQEHIVIALMAKTGNYQVANVNVRNLPDEVHRAIRIQAALHGRSTEAEIRDILERAARPEGRVKLGSFLASIAREVGGLTDKEHTLFENTRITSPARAVSFE